MIEPLFGGSPMLPGIPAQGFSWYQAPIPVGGTPGFGPQPISQLPLAQGITAGSPGGIAPMAQTGFGLNFGQALPIPGQFVLPAGVPVLGPEVVSIPALLAAVAMRRGQPLGPGNESEIEDFIYDALELIPGANDVEVRFDNGRVMLSGNVSHRRLKRDVGEIAWAIAGITDVQNNINIAARRRSRGGSGEQQGQVARKQG